MKRTRKSLADQAMKAWWKWFNADGAAVKNFGTFMCLAKEWCRNEWRMNRIKQMRDQAMKRKQNPRKGKVKK